jgi:hypothetical protein
MDEGKAAIIGTVAGVGVIGLGIVHAHWPGWLKTIGLDDNATLGWTDAKAITTDSQGNYLNVGSILLFGIGAFLLFLGPAVPWAYLAGLFLIVMGVTIYLWQVPYG